MSNSSSTVKSETPKLSSFIDSSTTVWFIRLERPENIDFIFLYALDCVVLMTDFFVFFSGVLGYRSVITLTSTCESMNRYCIVSRSRVTTRNSVSFS